MPPPSTSTPTSAAAAGAAAGAGAALALAATCACALPRWGRLATRSPAATDAGTDALVSAELGRLQRWATERGAPPLYERAWRAAVPVPSHERSVPLRVLQFNLL
jgi:hypothetical protein